MVEKLIMVFSKQWVEIVENCFCSVCYRVEIKKQNQNIVTEKHFKISIKLNEKSIIVDMLFLMLGERRRVSQI